MYLNSIYVYNILLLLGFITLIELYLLRRVKVHRILFTFNYYTNNKNVCATTETIVCTCPSHCVGYGHLQVTSGVGLKRVEHHRRPVAAPDHVHAGARGRQVGLIDRRLPAAGIIGSSPATTTRSRVR